MGFEGFPNVNFCRQKIVRSFSDDFLSLGPSKAPSRHSVSARLGPLAVVVVAEGTDGCTNGGGTPGGGSGGSGVHIIAGSDDVAAAGAVFLTVSTAG